MTLLYPAFLWLLIPLLLALWKMPKLIERVHLVILILLVLSLSRPVLEHTLQEATVEAKDIIIALDVSYSMQATDIVPSRYTFAKETIKALLKANPSDNVMLIAFTSNPLLLSPPTTDHRLINIALESLNPEYILTKGTSLEKLFKKLAQIKSGHKNLVLITDGGEEKELEKLTALVYEADIRLTILALGTNSGTTVTKQDGSYLKDNEGNLVISRINPLLESLASSVEGTYLTASSTAISTASTLSSALDAQQDKAQEVQKMQYYYLELYQVPLALAVLLFLLLHTRGVKYLLILFTFIGFQAEASVTDTYHLSRAYEHYTKADYNATLLALKEINTPSLQSQMTLANTYYKQNAFKKSINVYKSIRSTSISVKQQLYYNIANAYAMQKSYSKAKVYYTKALQLGTDADTKHNLTLVALLADKKDAHLGIAHPKSQDASSSKSESQDKDETRSEDEPSSGSGGAGKSSEESSSEKEKQEKSKLLDDGPEDKHPLSSKVYELINKGYIHETQPW